MLPIKKDIKLVRSLQQKKFRKEHGLFVVEGKKMVEEGLKGQYKLHSLYSTDESFVKLQSNCFSVTSKEMEMMSALSTPSSYLAVFRMTEVTTVSSNDEFILALDGIADPGNLGTIIRTAEWFGVRTILISEDTVELFNPKTVQSTMGSIFRMNVHSVRLADTLGSYRDNGYAIVGALLNGENAFRFEFPSKSILVIGSESHGIRPDVITQLSHQVTIPGGGEAESLNAAIACSILLSRWFDG
ncbi:MAG: TrmH family RNA methyltransferase [Flavobacteriales bacterium]|jgi:TrmH family RNA methyltransferase